MKKGVSETGSDPSLTPVYYPLTVALPTELRL